MAKSGDIHVIFFKILKVSQERDLKFENWTFEKKS